MTEATQVMTLTEFLLARIAEDEASLPGGFDCWYPPERYAAECEAKRRIVAGLTGVLDQSRNEQQIQNAQTTLGHLAAVYADHPDYRAEWRP